MSKPAFNIDEFCSAHGVSRATVYRAIKAGRLVALKTGTRTLISAEAASAWLNALERMPSAAERAA